MKYFSDEVCAFFWGSVFGFAMCLFLFPFDVGPLTAAVVYAWAAGMLFSIPFFIMVFLVLPWLSGWRKVTYNVNWTDDVKRYQVWKAVKWTEVQPGRPTNDNPTVRTLSRVRDALTSWFGVSEHGEVADEYEREDSPTARLRPLPRSALPRSRGDREGQGLDRYDD